MYFEFTAPTRLIFGEGTLARLGEMASPLGSRALLVTGRRALKANGRLDQTLALLQTAGVAGVVYNNVTPNPTAATVDGGAELARREGCDMVIGLGGGSAMDAAKGIAVAATHEPPVRDFLVPDAAGHKATATAATLPLICVTTTAGTASELTPFAVITVSDATEKTALRSPYIYARVSIQDPELTYSMPPEGTAATGIDVLCHALESYISASAQPLTDLMAQEAIGLVGRYLPLAVADGSDVEARRQMMLANAYAGYGLACCGATVMHGLEHPVSAHYPHVAHGAGLATMLRPWARKLAPREPEKFARILQLLGHSAPATDEHQLVAASQEALGRLLQTVGLDLRLRDLGVNRDDLGTMAADTCRYMGSTLEKTPGGLSQSDCVALLEEAL